MASLADWIKSQTADYGQNRNTRDLLKLSEALRKDRQDINFGPEDSVILSSLLHPQEALKRGLNSFQSNVNTAMGVPDPRYQDEASPYAYGPTDKQKAESAFNLAGLLQTGAFASGAAPKSAGGILGTSISNSAMNKIIKELEASNKSTVPKIPTGNVFNNSLGEIPLDTRLKADNYFSGTNQPQQINISDIVPTQKNITLNNLKGVNNIDDPVNAVMMNGKYYLTDGHHRVSLANLNNEKSISANVFDGEKINPNLNAGLMSKDWHDNISTILDKAESIGNNHYGIRLLSHDPVKKTEYKAGDKLKNSVNLDDYNNNDLPYNKKGKLDGTSSFKFDYDGYDIDNIDRAIKQALKFKTDNERIALIGGNDSFEGQMANERVINNAKILHLFSNDDLDSILGNSMNKENNPSLTSLLGK